MVNPKLVIEGELDPQVDLEGFSLCPDLDEMGMLDIEFHVDVPKAEIGNVVKRIEELFRCRYKTSGDEKGNNNDDFRWRLTFDRLCKIYGVENGKSASAKVEDDRMAKTKFVVEGKINPWLNLKQICLCPDLDEEVTLEISFVVDVAMAEVGEVLKEIERLFSDRRKDEGYKKDYLPCHYNWRLTLARVGKMERD